MFLLMGAFMWVAVALCVAMLIGGGIRLADRRAPFNDHLAGLPEQLTVQDILDARVTQPSA
jgi:hypothetical protein